MKIFKEIMRIICQHPAAFGFGWAAADLFTGDYKNAAWVLFVVSIVFGIGYFTERLSD